MADCNSLFKTFNQSIKLDDNSRNLLKNTRDALRQHIKLEFSKTHTDYVPIFQTQGSFVMDTIIRPTDDDFDLDDGTYFNFRKNNGEVPTAQDVRKWISDVIGDRGNIIDKSTCIRVEFKEEGFHIDLPIYHADNFKEPFLAHKKDGWLESGPVEFIEWFEKKVEEESTFQKAFLFEGFGLEKEYTEWLSDIRKKDAQLRRIVRYLKSWGDEKRGEMPAGVVMTILAADGNYVANERDDISLRDTLVNIQTYLRNNGFKCIRPTRLEGEDLFASYTKEKKEYFKNALDNFIVSANQALNTPNQKDACPKWQKHLGNRFPCHLAKDEIEGAKTYVAAPIKNDNSRSAQK
jgi:hypothetical protein